MSFKREYIISQIDSGRFDSMTVKSVDGKYIVEALVKQPVNVLNTSFASFADNAESGRYFVELFTFEEKTGVGRKHDHEKAKSLLYIVEGARAPQINGGDQFQMIYKLQAELAEAKLDKRLNELEASNSGKMYGMLERLLIMMQPAQRANAAAPVIAGPMPQQQNATPEAEFMRLFDRWQDLDDKLPLTVQKLVEMAEKSPNDYKKYRDLIHTMNNE